ncbi:DUF1453 domain-containing protein [Actinomadura bangladeshensis]|uniref:DUF1453 domain-containing protein n=1 Tax=Actinomadura bangladeshensis TaxID=453573 RepID=A0A6L9Q9I4_9ACTN|nr:DUF1453 domain-containing protein [Actinomadura bangladeshensis]NEA20944.1 DUF1453 domain-containing protein [Actinomadura bangladeshensis]
MNTLDNVLLGLAVLALVLYRQLRTRSVDERRMYGLPLVLGVAAVAQGGLIDRGHPALGACLLAAEAVAAVGLGVLRAVTVRLWREDDGTLWWRGTGWTLAAWLASVAVRAGFAGAGFAAGIKPAAGGVLLFLAVTLLAQSLVVVRRAHELARFAPVNVGS